jgi:hypothetical protein
LVRLQKEKEKDFSVSSILRMSSSAALPLAPGMRPLYEQHSRVTKRSAPQVQDGGALVVAAEGITKVHLLFRAFDAPYFGRGAVRSIGMTSDGIEEGFGGEFQLVATAASDVTATTADQADRHRLVTEPRGGAEVILGTSKGRELVVARDVELEVRLQSFSGTKLPYAKFGVSAEAGFLNLNYFQRLVLRLVGGAGGALEVPLKFADGFVYQDWTQLLYDGTPNADGLGEAGPGSGLPVVEYVFNLVERADYVPPQVRAQRAAAAAGVAAPAPEVLETVTPSVEDE